MAWATKRDMFRGSLLKKGVPGRARVKEIIPDSTPYEKTKMRQVEYCLEITVDDGRGPYDLDNALLMSPWEAKVQPGDTLAVKVHPKKDKRLAIDWDAMGAQP